MNNKLCVIVADGEFPRGEAPLRALREADYICCCDGAVAKLVAAGFTPDAIVGDGDSITPELKLKFADIFHPVAEQESNDLTKATLHCRAAGYKTIVYIGATGRRDDHSIGNIFLLTYYHDNLGLDVKMLTDWGMFIPCHGDMLVSTQPGQQVSVFNISCSRLESKHLRWPVSPFAYLWEGTLNEATDTTVIFTADGSYILYLANPDGH